MKTGVANPHVLEPRAVFSDLLICCDLRDPICSLNSLLFASLDANGGHAVDLQTDGHTTHAALKFTQEQKKSSTSQKFRERVLKIQPGDPIRELCACCADVFHYGDIFLLKGNRMLSLSFKKNSFF